MKESAVKSSTPIKNIRICFGRFYMHEMAFEAIADVLRPCSCCYLLLMMLLATCYSYSLMMLKEAYPERDLSME